jgi:AcrR family transcriptional regulator
VAWQEDAMVPTKPSRLRLPPTERKEQILVAASDLIAKRGFNGVSLDDIAAACNFTKHGLLYHFQSKEKLLAAVLERRDENDRASIADVDLSAVRDASTARAVLTRLVHRNLQQRPLIHLYMTLSAEALEPDHPASEYFIERLALVREGLQRQVLTWHPFPDLAANELIGYLEGMQLQWLRDPAIDFARQWELFADRFFVDAST